MEQQVRLQDGKVFFLHCKFKGTKSYLLHTMLICCHVLPCLQITQQCCIFYYMSTYSHTENIEFDILLDFVLLFLDR
jgi:hypothetical protein